jgi:sarcosine oxidase
VIIVGGGVIGSAIGYFLLSSPAFDGRVLVVEKDPSYQYCTTARSVGAIRQQFSTPENIEISCFGAQFIKSADEYLGVEGVGPGLDFVENGFLFLATDAGLPVLEANHETQVRHGAQVTLLRPAEVRDRFPWLRVDDLAVASLGLGNEGWLDPYSLLQGFKRKAQALGARYLSDEVIGITRNGRRIDAVELAEGGRIPCSVMVNAAGARARDVAAMAGVALAVSPRKRNVFVFDCREAIAGCPLVIDASGMFFRPEGEQFICGISPEESADPECLDYEIDYGIFEDQLWPLLAHRVPAFEAIKLTNAWACHYAYNPFDQNAIVGAHPEVENLYFANGFSGHGLQQSPAVGRAVAELITYGEFRSLDLGRFGYDRFALDRPVRELNVI